MTFGWIPDADRDPHPRRTWLAECGFDLTVLALFRKEEMLPDDYRLEPGTLVVSNHQRDTDVPILTTVLCRRKGLHIRWPLPFFASREDFFQRGFLAGLLYTWPRPLRWLLQGVSLGWFFRIVRSNPMRRVREFTLAEAWRDLPDDVATERSLNARGRRESDAGAHAGGMPARPVAERFWGLRRLRAGARAALYPDFRATIEAQLEYFAALLDAGRVVYFAPEGTISGDGRLGRMRAGVRRIVQLAATPPRILPVAQSYDALAPGRLRVITRVGVPLHKYNAEEGAAFNAWVEMAIRELYPVNASHL
ncbi:MAG: 1-acyl-sn-glycerol-3-phosphate acyltransferase, partial [Gammaproteobacteria bacterium]|nr:1-acyl-sn-glycerol-3-phosphate acyltransferase [Gammaproteobacteria bacterium]